MLVDKSYLDTLYQRTMIATGEDATGYFNALHSLITSAVIDQDNFQIVVLNSTAYNSAEFIKNIVDIPSSSKLFEGGLFGEVEAPETLHDDFLQAFVNSAHVLNKYEYTVREYPVSFALTENTEDVAITVDIDTNKVSKDKVIAQQTEIELISDADIVDITFRGEAKHSGDFYPNMFAKQTNDKLIVGVTTNKKPATGEYFVFNGAVVVLYRRKL